MSDELKKFLQKVQEINDQIRKEHRRKKREAKRKAKDADRKRRSKAIEEAEPEENLDIVEDDEEDQDEKSIPTPLGGPSTKSIWMSVGMFVVAAIIDFYPWKSLW
jgi:septal ring factor EnvC (AmiA/AmiB activator)